MAMSNEFTRDWFDDGRDPAQDDPVRAARFGMKPALPKRFYEQVSLGQIDGRFAVLLDGLPARTRGRVVLSGPNRAVAEMLAAEWAAQTVEINPATMPATRIAHAALDSVIKAMAEVRADILKYAGSDLVCYRAGDPARLVEQQARLWDPVLAHIRARYGAGFLLSEGITFVNQPAESLARLAPRLDAVADPLALAALHVLTTVSGSALIAIMVADGALEADAGFEAGECDADYEAGIWGIDEEAAERRAHRLADFRAATALLRAIGG
jgi:chaperone required for assembly of F1-ATPase